MTYGGSSFYLQQGNHKQKRPNSISRDNLRFRTENIMEANLQKNGTNNVFIYKIWVSQFVGLLRQNHLYGLILHGFSERISAFFARIFCTDFLHGFFARIFRTDFCTDFLHGFVYGFLHGFFCADSLHELLHGFLHGLFARISWGVPKHLLRSAKNPQRKSPRKFSMVWGPSGEGLGRQKGEVETLANLTKASLGLGGLGGGTSGGSSHSSGLEPRFQKARSKSCQAKEC